MLPSGSRKAAKWQTPESHVSAMTSTPFALEFSPGLFNVGHPHPESSLVRDKRQILSLGLPETEGDVRRLKLALGHLALGKPENVAVPGDGTRKVARRDRDEVHLLDAHRLANLPPARVTFPNTGVGELTTYVP